MSRRPPSLRLFFLVWLVALLAFLLTGCSTIAGQFENRLACSLDREQAYFISKWMRIGIGAEIAPADTAVLCRSPR